MRQGVATRAVVAAAAAATMLALTSQAFGATSSDTTQFSVTAGTLAFGTAPDVPVLPALTLNGQAQTLNAPALLIYQDRGVLPPDRISEVTHETPQLRG